MVTVTHIISLLITLVFVLAAGLLAGRRVKSAEDYNVGGHKAGVGIVTGAIVGTIIGGASTVGTAQLAFTVGMAAWWFTLGAGIALLLLGLFYAAPLRATGLETIPQFMVLHYGRAAGPLAGLTASAGIFFSIVANILSALPLTMTLFDLTGTSAAGVVLLLVLAHVLFGGIWGAGIIGLLKVGIIYLTLIAAGIITWLMMGGVSGYAAVFPPTPWFDLLGRGAATDIASGLSLIVGTLSTQSYIQAAYSAQDGRTARNGAIAAALMTLPSGIPAIMVGLFMRHNHPDIAPIEALPRFILSYLPPWFGGIAMAGLLLAAVGSAAGLALGVSSMLVKEMTAWKGGRFVNEYNLWFSRIAVIAVTASATLFSFGNLRSLVLEWNFLSMALRGAGVFMPFTAAIFWPGRIKPAWGLAAMTGGAVISLMWKFMNPSGMDPLYPGLAVSALLVVLGWRRQ